MTDMEQRAAAVKFVADWQGRGARSRKRNPSGSLFYGRYTELRNLQGRLILENWK